MTRARTLLRVLIGEKSFPAIVSHIVSSDQLNLLDIKICEYTQ